MNRRTHQSYRSAMDIIIFCLLLGWVSVAGAQDSAVQFQETTEDSLKALSQPALQSKGAHTKGLAAIADDDRE